METSDGLNRTERKRRAILKAAEVLFLDCGFDRTSVDDVAAKAEVSKQTVYKQFDSKAALFVAVVQEMTGPAAARIHSDMREPEKRSDVKDVLMDHGEWLLQIALDRKLMRLRRLAISETDRFPELGKALYENGPQRAIDSLAVTLQRWSHGGLLEVGDAQLAATQFNWLIMAEPVNRAMFFGTVKLSTKMRQQHISSGVHLFLTAYQA